MALIADDDREPLRVSWRLGVGGRGVESIELADGRVLTYSVNGASAGRVMVWHHGTPGCGLGYRVIDRAAAERGLRVVWVADEGERGHGG